MKKKSFLSTVLKTIKGFTLTLPIIIGVILCIGLFNTFVSVEIIHKIFSGNIIFDTFIGSVVGSITAGNPINSYIIGEQLLADGVSLYTIIAFLICWVTVGIVQLPYEISMLGKKFAYTRNLLSFIFAIIISALGSVIIGSIS